jgi:hypothetical protein
VEKSCILLEKRLSLSYYNCYDNKKGRVKYTQNVCCIILFHDSLANFEIIS